MKEYVSMQGGWTNTVGKNHYLNCHMKCKKHGFFCSDTLYIGACGKEFDQVRCPASEFPKLNSLCII